MMIRLSVSMSDDLLKRVDKRAAELSLNRSAFISMCCADRIQRDEAFSAMPDILEFIKSYNNGNGDSAVAEVADG